MKLIWILMFLLFIPVVSAEVINEITEEQFLGYTRQQMFNAMNVTFQEYYFDEEYVAGIMKMRTVEERPNGLFVVDKQMIASVPMNIVSACRDTFTDAQCKNYLVLNDEPFDATIDGVLIRIEPMYYQIQQQVIDELDYLEKLQEDIEGRSSLWAFFSSIIW